MRTHEHDGDGFKSDFTGGGGGGTPSCLKIISCAGADIVPGCLRGIIHAGVDQ